MDLSYPNSIGDTSCPNTEKTAANHDFKNAF